MISIDVGNEYLTLTDLHVRNRKLKIKTCRRITMDEPPLDPDNNLKPDVLKGYLESAFKKVKAKKASITFSGLSAISNEHILAFDKNKSKMRSMVKSKVFQVLSPKEYIMDYNITRVFKEEGIAKCSVTAYVMPKVLIECCRDCLLSLGKKPLSFSVAQNNIFNFAKHFLIHQTMIIVNIDAKSITTHLIDFPDNIITRSAEITAAENNSVDLLAQLSERPAGGMGELADLISKLVQYHSIKYPNRKLDAIYIMGDGADDAAKEALHELDYAPVHNIGEACFPRLSPEVKVQSLIYAIGAILEMGE